MKKENFNEWFNKVIEESNCIDKRYNLKGFIVYKEGAIFIINRLYDIFRKELNKDSQKEIAMPLLIPESNFKKESEHVTGFTPEVFWVTEHGNSEPFEEKLALRPTSETAFYQMYSLWIRSYKDMPFKRYQCCSVYRYETKATKPFFRAREFFWIESHCAFSNKKDAKKQVKKDLGITKKIFNNLGIFGLYLKRPEWDKFAGAEETYAVDTILENGRALQIATSHYLANNFSKAFNILFKDKDEKEKFAEITCYGPGITRIAGSLIAVHSDEKGIRLPFELMPVQIVIIPIIKKDKKEKVLKKSKEIKNMLKKYNVLIDNSEKSIGEKFYSNEKKGFAIRIDIGPKDIEKEQVVIFRRDTNTKEIVKIKELKQKIKEIAKEYNNNLIEEARLNFNEKIVFAKNYEELKKAIENKKIAKIPFIGIEKKHEKYAEIIKKDLEAEVRGIDAFKKENPKEKCIISGKKASCYVYVAKSY